MESNSDGVNGLARLFASKEEEGRVTRVSLDSKVELVAGEAPRSVVTLVTVR